MTGALQDRVAIVTGGAQGIGRAISRCMTAAGATAIVGDIVIGDIVAGDIPATVSDAAAQFPLDVSDERSVETFVQRVVEEYGAPAILVNNAGIMTESAIADLTVEDWDRTLNVNLRGPLLMAKHVVPHMRADDRPAIVNIGSLEGFAGNPHHAAYIASKAGLHGLTLSLAIDLGPQGIRANAIAPGWIDTDLNKRYLDDLPDRGEAYRQLGRIHPLGHIGDPGDVANVAVWLASDAARFVTGQIIKVEGGCTAKLPLPAVFNV